MDYKEFLELATTRQATRGFLDKRVEQEKLDKIIQVARLAPSACNSQPWKMYAVSSPDMVKKVTDCFQGENRNTFTSTATAVVVISEVMPENLKPDVVKKYGLDHFVKYDVGELLAYITLSAKTLGVDSCIIGWMDSEKLKSVLNAKDNEVFGTAVVLGYSDAPLREKSRKPLAEIVEFI
jgi:nitroreductase